MIWMAIVTDMVINGRNGNITVYVVLLLVLIVDNLRNNRGCIISVNIYNTVNDNNVHLFESTIILLVTIKCNE